MDIVIYFELAVHFLDGDSDGPGTWIVQAAGN
jgi:hypothetical protein